MIDGAVLEEDSYEYSGPVAKCRGEKNKAEQAVSYAAQQERQTADARAQQAWEQQQAQRANLTHEYQQLYDNPLTADEQAMYATPVSAEESAAQLATAGGPFSAARANMEHEVGVTGNYSGLNEGEGQLARDRSQALSQAEAHLGDEAYQRRTALDQLSNQRQLAAMQALTNLYGVDASTLAKMTGMPAEYLQIQGGAANSIQPGFGDIFADSFASGLGSNLSKAFDPSTWYTPS